MDCSPRSRPGIRDSLTPFCPDLRSAVGSSELREESTASRTFPSIGSRNTASVVLANLEVADKLGVAFLPSIPLFASVGGAGGGFLGFLSPAYGASA
jgi:hypothetical protein